MGILSNLAKNPSLIALGALGIGLFIFRDKISGFFSDITGGAKTANILGENLLSNLQGTQDLLLGVNKFFTDFKFPEITFPEFNFTLPDFFPPTAADVGTDIDKALAGGATAEDIADIIGIDPTDPNQDPTKFLPPDLPPKEPTVIFRDAEIFAKDFPETFKELPVSDFKPLPSGFEGGGVSFEGGAIFETPIANLSLSQIIDKFMVTASQAADIRGRARDDFGDFDFGTNTGGGIGSIFQDLELTSQLPASNVSDPVFSGLSAEEIVNRLTGGNIQNF